MITFNFLTGTTVLLAASFVNAGPCRPIPSSTVITSASETSISSSETETATETTAIVEATSTASIDATQTDVTSSESETGTTVIVETTPVSSADTTTTEAVTTAITTTAAAETTIETTSDATTTTAAATTTTEAAEALQSVYLIAHDSEDPQLAPLGGVGFTELEDTQIPGFEYIDFTTNVASDLFFTIGERTGQVKIGNGANAGQVAFYSYINNNFDFSLVIVGGASDGQQNDLTALDCQIVDGTSVPQQLQCKFGPAQNAEFWTCGSRLAVVRPGTDFTNECSGQTSYKVDVIEARMV